MITDAQIHLWEANNTKRPWPPGIQPDIEPPMTGERFVAIMDEAGVGRAIISPPGVTGFDNSYAIECVLNFPGRYAITSRWTLDDTDRNPSQLATWLDQPGMIGIRFALMPNDVQAWRASGLLAAFWADAARYDIPLFLFSPEGVEGIKEIERAAIAHPDLKLVVDHVNLVGSTPDTVSSRIDGLIDTLAKYPNVGVKLGSLPLRSAGFYPFEDLREPMMRVYNAFGANRLMWASDLTTTLKAKKGTYQENLDMIRKVTLSSIPSSDMDMILGGTVSQWFRWPQ
jgi:predicted TIM-barrel fold metal-dependent hydrolase